MTVRLQRKISLRSSGPRMSLKIRIRKEIWNSYDPSAPRVPKPALRLKLKLTSITRGQPRPPRGSPRCKVKLWKFHYGGPLGSWKGSSRNKITYEQPCLEPTCANCRRWHPHLLQIAQRTDSYPNEQQLHRPHEELISPEIDPRILDGAWQFFASRRSSVRSTKSRATTADGKYWQTPVLTPVKASFNHCLNQQPRSHSSMSHRTPSGSQYNILLPTALLTSALSTDPTTARTGWLAEPRRQYMARLTFSSHEGKRKYRVLLQQRQRREEKREYDRARRAQVRKNSGGEAQKRSVRSRHRVRLMFRSEQGRRGFRQVVGSA